jgi:TonB family protein
LCVTPAIAGRMIPHERVGQLAQQVAKANGTIGRQALGVTVRDFSSSATCYAGGNGAVRPEAGIGALGNLIGVFMSLFSHLALRYCAVTLWLIPSFANATSAEELYELPPPQACITQLGVMAVLVHARDKGLSSSDAREFVLKMRPNAEVSKELIENVFGHPDLEQNPLERYTLWSCHARTNKVPTVPLDIVAADMRECYAKSASSECALIFQNRITGLAPAFRPKSSMVRAPMPSTSPPTKLRSAMPRMPCERPVWPREALKNELKGTVTMKFLVGADRHVLKKGIVKSSGHEILDLAALEATARCVFDVAQPNDKLTEEWVAVQYVWSLD